MKNSGGHPPLRQHISDNQIKRDNISYRIIKFQKLSELISLGFLGFLGLNSNLDFTKIRYEIV